MVNRYVVRQAVTAALTANAIRPLPGFRLGVPSFFAGWLTGELAPHVLALTAADTAGQLARGRRDPLGLALAGASVAGLGYLIVQSQRSAHLAEEALVEALGVHYVEQLDEAPTPADLATPWRRVANPFAFGRERRRAGVEVQRDVPFAPYGKRGMLDIYTSTNTPSSGAPVLLHVHGGAWTIGKKEEQGLALMERMAAKGWVCVSVNYRLAPRNKWPAQIVDVKQAIAWIKQNITDYGGDPDYVAITGGSAGGHLTALAALTPNDPAYQPGFEEQDTSVQVAVPHYGVFDIAGVSGQRNVELMRDLFLAKRVFEQPYATAPEVYEAATPLLRVTADAPDFFVVHGRNDTLVGVEQARQLVQRLRETSKRSVVYVELPHAQHAFDVIPSIRGLHIVRAIDRYLHWHWNSWRVEQADPSQTLG
ncbi:alpha/beta hydrolase [Nocardioides pelophilus]|uniref:alpha/beta hydrolase n=1 Tax=Nocardioides pelophilus TaxID=2172019 RepID=UPI0015FFB763|nr:alpha/beta hydrolase [Nocardioides pelophilus]